MGLPPQTPFLAGGGGPCVIILGRQPSFLHPFVLVKVGLEIQQILPWVGVTTAGWVVTSNDGWVVTSYKPAARPTFLLVGVNLIIGAGGPKPHSRGWHQNASDNWPSSLASRGPRAGGVPHWPPTGGWLAWHLVTRNTNYISMECKMPVTSRNTGIYPPYHPNRDHRATPCRSLLV